MIETISADLITKLILASSSRIRAQLATASARRRDGKGEIEAILELLSVSRAVDSKRFLGIDLPPGLDQNGFRSFMQDASSSAVAFEVISASLAGAQPHELEKIRERWKIDSAPLLSSINEDQRFAFVNQMFSVLIDEAKYITRSIEERHPNALEKVREHARHSRLYAILEALERRASIYQPNDSEMAIADSEWLKIYRSQAEAAHGHLTPPDFDRRRSVPIADLYVSPSILSRAGQTKLDTYSLADTIDRSVLLGDPGGGKTTASTVLMHHFAISNDQTAPFLVILREFASDGKTDKSVVEHIESRMNSKYQCEAPDGTVERLLVSGKALVIFDGLDELLDTSLRRDVADAVSLFCNRYPLTRVLVTSRSVGYDQAALDPRTFAEWEIAGFDDDRVRDYTNKWFQQDGSLDKKAAQTWSDAFVEESNEVSDLRTNPLLLALMCIIYRGEQSLPRNRPAVYEKCATMLFEKWDSHRRIHTSLQVGPLVDPAMKYLAYWMITNPDTNEGVIESRLVNETTTYLKTRTFEDEFEAEAAAREFVEFCRGRAWVFSDAGTTADGEPLYKFTHRTFMEYFAAYHLARRNDSPEKLGRQLAKRVANAEWDVIAQLAVQITDKHTDSGADRIFRLILNEKVKRTAQNRANQLAFLARCLSFATVSPSSIRSLTRQIIENMKALTATEPVRPEKSPLVPLLASRMSQQTLGLISDEFSRTIGHNLKSEDIAERKAALFIVTGGWLSCYFHVSQSLGQNRDYWRNHIFGILDAHRDQVLDLAGSEPILRYYAVGRGYAGIVDIYNLVDGNLTPAFESAYDRLYAVGLWAPAQSLFSHWTEQQNYLKHYADESRISLEQLCAFAATANPLLEATEDNLTEITYSFLQLITQRERLGPSLTSQELGGLAILYFVAFEALEYIMKPEVMAKIASRGFSAPEFIESYLFSRASGILASGSATPLPDLCPEMRELMERWAAREYSIVTVDSRKEQSLRQHRYAPYMQTLMDSVSRMLNE